MSKSEDLKKVSDLFGMEENSYIMLMRLSQFAGYSFAGLGFIAPIVLWLLNKRNTNIDKRGKNIANFTISRVIYYNIAFVLAILRIVFIIMTTVKAANDEYRKYPMTINFIS